MKPILEEISTYLKYALFANQWKEKLTELESRGIFGERAKTDVLIMVIDHLKALEEKLNDSGDSQPTTK